MKSIHRIHRQKITELQQLAISVDKLWQAKLISDTEKLQILDSINERRRIVAQQAKAQQTK